MVETVDLVTFTEQTLDGKLYFLCSDLYLFPSHLSASYVG